MQGGYKLDHVEREGRWGCLLYPCVAYIAGLISGRRIFGVPVPVEHELAYVF